MEQRVLNTRSVKTTGEGGLETWTTVVLDSLHYESHLMCTNCGPLGIKGENEPSTNRAALSDRSWAHIVHSNDDHDTGDVEFDVQKCSDDIKQQINRYRVCACLVAYVLIFIKHIPSCRPNLTYANMLCNKWYEILWTEYNLPRPSKRKKIKLRMMFELFATESAVFEKFLMPESGMDYADMLPDENGHLSPFCIEHLVDVVRSLQRCLDMEVIHTAWSHSLDHSPATSAHIFQMKTVLAQLHGSELDRRTLVGEPPARPMAPAAPAPPSQGRVDPVSYDQAALQHMRQQYQHQNQPPPQQDQDEQMQQFDFPPVAPTSAPAAPTGAPGTSAPPVAGPPPPMQPRTGTPANWPNRDQEPIGQTTDEHGHPNNTGNVVTRQIMEAGLTRQRAAETADDLAMQRELRCELSCRALTQKIARDSGSEYAQVTKLMTDCVGEKDKEPKHRMASTGTIISARSAAGACMPNASDLLSHGIEETFLKNIACGQTSKAFHGDGAKIGIGMNRWQYETLPGEVLLKGPECFDFNWAHMIQFARNGGTDQAMSATPKQKSLWTNSARVIKQASSAGTFSLMAAYSMTMESMRDVLFMIGWSTIENKIRIPKKIHVNRWGNGGNSRQCFNIANACMLSEGYGFEDTKQVKTIHPKHMFHETRQGVYDLSKLNPAFETPVGIERPSSSLVGNSLGQKRLDHLADNRALPTCILPEGFERGVPIKECEAFNGIYFNKHTASEQSALVLETGLFLATVPGIAGGRFSTVPDTFKGIHPNPSRDKDLLEAAHEEARQQQSRRAAAEDVLMPEARSVPPTRPTRDVAELLQRIDHDNQLQPNQVLAGESEVDGDDVYVEHELPPSPGEGDANSDLDSVERSVAYPESDGTDVRAEPGATDRAARASVDPSAAVPALPYEWDQLALFMSLKMVETLHNDVHDYVDRYRCKYADVYSHETRNETLMGLPQVSIRFPGVVDSKSKETGEEKTSTLMPLSVGVPLKQSRYCDVAKQIKRARASKGLTEAVHSFAHGRAIAFNDPEVLEQEAEARGIDAGISMVGNLFARSTWQRFTLSALDSRGMRTPEEESRVADQGLCMRLRVRNSRAAQSDHEDAEPSLVGDNYKEAQACSFAAQERNKRKLGDVDEDDEAPRESLNCKRRSLERERERELMDESMMIEPNA